MLFQRLSPARLEQFLTQELFQPGGGRAGLENQSRHGQGTMETEPPLLPRVREFLIYGGAELGLCDEITLQAKVRTMI